MLSRKWLTTSFLGNILDLAKINGANSFQFAHYFESVARQQTASKSVAYTNTAETRVERARPSLWMRNATLYKS